MNRLNTLIITETGSKALGQYIILFIIPFNWLLFVSHTLNILTFGLLAAAV